MNYFSGDLAGITQEQLANAAQEQQARRDQNDYFAKLAQIQQQRDAASGVERVGMDTNDTTRYGDRSRAGTSRYVADSNAGTSRYATDATITNAALQNQFNRYKLAQEAIDAEKNRQNQIALITAQGDQNFRLQSVNPYGNSGLGKDMYEQGVATDQGNQNANDITAQANATLPKLIEDASQHWHMPWGDSENSYRAALAAGTNATPEQSILRTKLLTKAQTAAGALDPATGVPRFSLPPAATNFVPMLRTNSNPMMRRVITLQPDGTNALPVLRTGGFSTNSAGQIVVTTKAERDALPPGTTYVAPDGVVRTKSQ